MSRSIKKGPLSSVKLEKKLEKNIVTGIKKPIKIFNKALIITPSCENMTFLIHNGKNYATLSVKASQVGESFGNFCETRKFGGHKEKTKDKTREKNKK